MSIADAGSEASIAAAASRSSGAQAQASPNSAIAVRATRPRNASATPPATTSHTSRGRRPTVSRLGRSASLSWRSATSSGSRSPSARIALPFISSGTSTPSHSRIVGATSVARTTPSVRVESEVRLPSNPLPAIPVGHSGCSLRLPAANAMRRSSGPSPRTRSPSSANSARTTLIPGGQSRSHAPSEVRSMSPLRSAAISGARPSAGSDADLKPALSSVEPRSPGITFAGTSSALRTIRSHTPSSSWPSRT